MELALNCIVFDNLYSEQFEFGAYWSLYGVKSKDLIAYLDFFPRKTTGSKNRESLAENAFLKI